MPDKKKSSRSKSISKEKTANPGQRTLDQLFAGARRLGADVQPESVGGSEEAEKLTPHAVPLLVDVSSAQLQPPTEESTEPTQPAPAPPEQRRSARLKRHVAGTRHTSPPSQKRAISRDDRPIDLTDGSPGHMGSQRGSIFEANRPETSTKGSRIDPIVVPSSPARPAEPTKPLFSIFTTTMTAAKNARLRSPSPLRKEQRQFAVPWPDREGQHVRGLQSLLSAPPLSFPRRHVDKGPRSSDRPSLVNFNYSIYDDVHSSCPCSAAATRTRGGETTPTPTTHQNVHPSIAKILAAPTDDSMIASQMLWAEKWRPTRAEEVLGNEHHALYLRDWLLALELQSLPVVEDSQSHVTPDRKGKSGTGTASKRPRVIRGVDKARGRKRRRRESWIVSSDESEEEDQWPDGASEDDFEFCSRMVAGQQRNELDGSGLVHSQHHFDDQLTNAILLTGPCGSGKTAAVYACADELDWEIFEVHPGVGKRSGANLDHLVGEVGKNHLVRKTHPRDRPHGKVKHESPLVVTQKGLQSEIDHDGADKTTDGFGFLGTNVTSGKNTGPGSAKARQSLILLEEVDVVFRDDVNFWPAVINLLKSCQRPVIMTCNDLSLVPVHDLALQSILEFHPCPTPLAVSYLHARCSAEQRHDSLESLVQLYESTYHVPSIDVPDIPLNPFTENLPLPDLRRAINQLQPPRPEGHACVDDVEYQLGMEDWFPQDVPDDKSLKEQMTALLRHTDAVSFVDSFIARGPMSSPEGLAASRYEPSSDDELGHVMLFSPSGKLEQQESLQFYCQDELIAQEVLKRSRVGLVVRRDVRHMMAVGGPFRAHALFRSRVAYQSRVVGALDLLPLSAPLLPRPAVFLDYLPGLRNMLRAEGSREGKGEGEKQGRQTENSRKSGRMIAITEEHRGDMVHTALVD